MHTSFRRSNRCANRYDNLQGCRHTWRLCFSIRERFECFFEPEGVINVHRIRRKVDGNFVPSTTLILTCDRPSLPYRIHCEFFNLWVRQYVPNPLHCFKCQRLGHTQEHCMSQAICVSCGQKAHSPPCQSSPHCINCDGPHDSNSRHCLKFHMGRVIQKIRSTDKVSFPEGRHRYHIQHPVDFSRSFFSVLKSSNSTSSSQTMWCIRRSVDCRFL